MIINVDSNKVKELMIQLAIDDKFPLDLTQLDVDGILKQAQVRTVAGFTAQDVQYVATEYMSDPVELTDEDVNKVMDLMDKMQDANLGVDWDFIEDRIKEYIQNK